MSALLHMLGLDERHRAPWRNCYVTGPEGDAEIDALVAAGLVVEVTSPKFLAEGDRSFLATAAGKAVAVVENERLNPPPSPARARYMHWLTISDVSDIKFGEYLRLRLYNDPSWGTP